MNFEKSYVSNLQNLFENTGTGESEQSLYRQPSPKVANFENRPILSYTIPTNDCTSPGSKSKMSLRNLEYRKILSKSEAKVSEVGRHEEGNSLNDGIINRNDLSFKTDCTPSANSKNYSIQENESRMSRNRSLRLRKDEVQSNFQRLSSNRRSLQQGVRTQITSINRSIDRSSKFSPQVTKEEFVSRIRFLRNEGRSKSSQRDETLKVCEEDELLTDQRLPCFDSSIAREDGDLKSNSCGSHGSGMLRIRNLMNRTVTRESHSQVIREGVISSSSSPPPEINTNNNRNQLNSTVRRTLSMHSSDQSVPRTPNYNYDGNKKTNQFIRFGSLRVPSSSSSSSSSSPFVKKRISFAQDQQSENSSENEFSIDSCDNNSEVRSLFENLNAANWQSRREGLSNIQVIMDQSPDMLGGGDLKRITDSFTKMFHDPHSKVCSLFLELLPSFVSTYSVHLPRHWLHVCLNKLFTKCGTELLGSMQVKIKKSLEAIRESFDCNQHFGVMNSLVNNHTLMHNSKSRESFVNHVKEFMVEVDPIDLCPRSDLTELVRGLIKLLERYQSIELKKNIQSILVSMFDLSPPTFSAIMYSQPRDVQDFMTKIVRHHVSSLTKVEQCSSPSSSSSSLSFNSVHNNSTKFNNHHHHQIDSHYSSSNSSDSAGPSMRNITSSSQPTRPSSLLIEGSFPSRIPQRIESPFKNSPKTPTQLRNSISSELNTSSSSSSSSSQPTSASPSNSITTPQLIRKVSLNRSKLFGNNHSIDSQHVTNNQSIEYRQRNHPRKEQVNDECTDEEFDLFVEQFSNIDLNNKVELKQALKQLIKQLPSNPDLIKDVHLTSLLSVLLSAPEDIDECSLIAAECLTTLFKTRRIDESLLILKRILDSSDQSNVLQALRWIKFQLGGVRASEISEIIGDVIASVLKVSDNEDKSVRTVSILVLVQIFRLVGDDVWIHLQGINNHKRTLLQMYFKRPMKQY